MYVKVKYYKGGGFYSGGEYTYQTTIGLQKGDKVIAPTVKELRQRAIVTEVDVKMPSFSCREITEFDPDGEVVTE